MSDSNRGRGRGRGDGNFRGDRGGSRGGSDRGRGGGGFRGDSGSDRGRGGGGSRGDRGDRGGGGFRGDRGGGGFRGDRGDRGRGGFRGDRGGQGGGGGFRGGRGGYAPAGPSIYKPASGAVPVPEESVTKLEDKWAQSADSVSVTELSERAGKLGITSSNVDVTLTAALPRRPAYGTTGTPVVLWANYFSMEIKSQTLFKYALKVNRSGSDDAVVGKLLRTIVQKALQQVALQNPKNRIVSEYKAKVVSQGKLTLPPGGGPVLVVHKGRKRPEEYQVTFSPAEDIDIGKLMQWLTTMDDRLDDIVPKFPKFESTIDAIGIIMGHYARSSARVVSLGASSAKFFPSEANNLRELSQLSALRNVVRGYFSSARPATGRLLLNVNVTHSTFHRSGNAMELIRALLNECRVRDLRSPSLRAASRKIARIKFEVTVFDEKGKECGVTERSILELSRTTASTTTFRLDEKKDSSSAEKWADGTPIRYGETISVAEYYRKRFKKTVDDRLPLIVSGTSRKKLYFPSDFCRILPDQCAVGKLSAGEASAMVNFACRAPALNAESIVNVGANMLGISGAVNEILKAFGITVDASLITVHGRVLVAPMLSYLNQANKPQTVTVRDGSWNLRDLKVVKGGTVTSWACLTINDPNDQYGKTSFNDVQVTMSAFVQFLNQNMGIKIPALTNAAAQLKTCRFDEGDEYLSILKNGFGQLQSPKPMMVFVILPDSKDAAVYNAVKRICDIDLGIHTVCMVRKNLFKGGPGQNPQYYANVGLKVNLKAGGINHKLSQDTPKGGKTMYVGWDVVHPTNLGVGRDSGLPSVVGLVSSIDEHLAQWPAVAWAQKGGQEMADNRMEERFGSRLALWQKHNQGRLPEKIIIFRDGVSEGQFATVEHTELSLVRKACAKVYGNKPKPKITLIVSVKRHQTRFYPTDEKDMSRSMNNKSGTVVDRGVTVARYWDFFLQSHDAIKGTARPARYTVIHNEIFPTVKGANAADELEKLTHSLSFLFGRATKAVSICPPAYYADIVCTRHRSHLAEIFDSVIMGGSVISGQTGSSDSSNIEQQILDRAEALTVHQNLANSMYWI